MKSYPNIEKLPGKKHYTGYANGVWTIRKDGIGWTAIRVADGRPTFTLNLTAMSKRLADIAEQEQASRLTPNQQ